ncbi:MAG: cytochrome c-type biogenesis CcmF C-terminal domain-containing protein [Pseudomonadota bacterium]
MYTVLAQLGLIVSILLSLILPGMFYWLKNANIKQLNKTLDNFILVQFITISFAFISLSYAYLSSDFSLFNVFKNSHIAIPTIYKFSGLWSNHEGSMLLWLFLLCIINLITNQHKMLDNEKIFVSASQILITSSIVFYTILKSNPFIKLSPIPLQGIGFNPLLQDVGLVIHPPILYIGYVSCITCFTLCISALINKNLSAGLLQIMHKWALFSWSFLTLGVSLGSWWAYRELGWGGYWFWDPVENASLLPWLTSTALIHSIYTNKKLNTNFKSTILLALFTFLLSILSTFLVRSGIVTSVHAFANDPDRGIFILSLLTIYSCVALFLFAIKGHYFQTNSDNGWFSRYGGINLGNILWAIASALILASILYPIALNFYTGEQITIDSNFFEKTFMPLLILILLIMALTMPTGWQVILPIQYKHFFYSIIISLPFSIGFYYFSIAKPSLISLLGFFIGSLVIVRMGFWYYLRSKTPLTYKFYLIWLVHLAAGLFSIIISITETNSQEALIKIREGERMSFAQFNLFYAKTENLASDNFMTAKIILYLEKDNTELAILAPEIRYYPIENKQTSESAIYHGIFYDFYVVINEITEDKIIGIKLYFKPLMTWLWITCILVFIIGMMLLINMRNKKYELKALN